MSVASVYSERFVMAYTPGVWTDYVVPAGMRAVLRNILFSNTSGAATFCMVLVGNAVCWRSNQESNTSGTHDVRVVAYAGEIIGAYVAVDGARVTLNGFLFNDSSRAELQDGQRGPDPPGDAVLID